jgi:predicted metal-dependent HD superfamily phosphohydrolase
MQPYSHLVTNAENFSTQLITSRVGPDRFFHNLTHTVRVARNCLLLAQLESCTYEDTEQLLVAAWFHDTGYVAGSSGHEQESVKIFLAFIAKFNRSEDFNRRISELILATKMPTAPSDLLEGIICDADTSHLGAAEYDLCEKQLRRELEHSEKIVMSDHEWVLKNIAFFQQHHYYTEHARVLWDEQKRINLLRLTMNR